MSIIVNCFLLIGFLNGQSVGWWMNTPYECSAMDDAEINQYTDKLCNIGDYHYNLKNIKSYDKVLNMGKVCFPSSGKSKTHMGYLCKKLVKKTICYVDAKFNKIIIQDTSYENVTKEECHKLVVNRVKYGKNQQMSYPPPRCSYLRNLTTETVYYRTDLVQIEDNPLEEWSYKAYKLNNNGIDNQEGDVNIGLIEIGNWESEYCRLENWNCILDENDLTKDMVKPGHWINLQFTLIRLNILYEMGLGLIDMQSLCKLKFCGRYVLYTSTKNIYFISNNDLLNRIKLCPKISRLEVSYRQPDVKSVSGPLKLAIETRLDRCNKIKNTLISGGQINWNDVHYLTPISPGPNIALGFKEVTSIVNVLRDRKILTKRLIVYKCNYWPTDYRYYQVGNKSRVYYHRREGSRVYTPGVPEFHLVTETKGKNDELARPINSTIINYQYGINGVFKRDEVWTLPTSRIIDLLLRSVHKNDNYTYIGNNMTSAQKWLEDENYNEMKIIESSGETSESNQTSIDQPFHGNNTDFNDQQTSTEIIIDRPKLPKKDIDESKTVILSRNHTIYKAKDIINGIDLDITMWGIGGLVTILILFKLYVKIKKNRKIKNRI